MDEPQSVTEWLVKLKLDQYVSGFITNGYDELSSCTELSDHDLDSIGVTLPGHKKRLMVAAKKLNQPASPAPVVKRKPMPTPAPRPVSVVSPPQAAKRPVSMAPPPRSPHTKITPTRPVSMKSTVAATPEVDDQGPPALPRRNNAKSPEPKPEAPKAPKIPTVKEETEETSTGPPLPKANAPKTNSDAARFMDAVQNKRASNETPDPSLDPALVIEVEDESMGVIRTVTINEDSNAKEAIALYTQAHNLPPVYESELGNRKDWRLFEAFATPNVERVLPDNTPLLKLKRKWPKVGGVTVPGCRFILRAAEASLYSHSNVAYFGTLDKRSGSKSDSKNVKSWKSRHFRLEEDGLRYFKSAPKSQKAAKQPLGVWPVESWLVYSLRGRVKGAKYPEFCFCLKFDTFPTWEPDEKDADAQLNHECRMMSAPDEETRVLWITSIQAAQSVNAESIGDVRRQRMESVSTLPKASEVVEKEEVASSEDEDPTPLPPKTTKTTNANANATSLNRPVSSAIPNDFKPIEAKKIRGVGFGNIFAEIPKKVSTNEDDESGAAQTQTQTQSQSQTQTQTPLLPPRSFKR